MLGKKDWRLRKKGGRKKKERKDEGEISKKELDGIIGKLMEEKSAGRDGIANEI